MKAHGIVGPHGCAETNRLVSVDCGIRAVPCGTLRGFRRDTAKCDATQRDDARRRARGTALSGVNAP